MTSCLHLFGSLNGTWGHVSNNTSSYHIPATGEIYERVFISSGGYSFRVFVLQHKTHQEILAHLLNNFRAPKT